MTAQVILHVVGGRVDWLEIFAGEGVAAAFTGLTGLTDTTVT